LGRSGFCEAVSWLENKVWSRRNVSGCMALAKPKSEWVQIEITTEYYNPWDLALGAAKFW
jgi:hypothetical protein